MSSSEGLLAAATLARTVDLLRQSPEPGPAQKAALRALIAFAAERSATFRHYNDVLTVDGETVATTDPRLAAFAERLVAQHVAEITIAKGAGADELLALAIGLASDAGQGRIKERLRDANSTRVMVVYHQYDTTGRRSVSAAFEKVKVDRAVLDEWNKFIEEGARTEAERMPDGPTATPPAAETAAANVPAAATVPPPAAAPAAPPAAPRGGGEGGATPIGLPPPPGGRGAPEPPPPRPSQVIQQPPGLQGSASLGNWFAAFERSLKGKFPDHFGDVDWGYRVDRSAGTVHAGDRSGRASVSVPLPEGFVDQSAWLLAGKVLEQLRRVAEERTGLRKKR